MIKETLQLFKHPKVKNFSFLSFAQLANYLIPLILIPYLVSVLGIEKYGLITLILACATYIISFTEYGFTLVSAKDIAKKKNSLDQVSRITNSIYFSKISLFIIIFILFFISQFAFNYSLDILILSYGAFVFILGEVLFPSWFFQGFNEMKYIASLRFLGRVLFVILVLVFVNSESKFIYVTLFQGIGQLLASFAAVYILKAKHKIQFHLPTKRYVIHYLCACWPIFVSTIFVKLYNSTNTIILGLFTNVAIVGYYSIAEKVVLASAALVGTPFNQVIYPYLSQLSKNIKQFKIYVKKTSIILLILNIITALLIFVFAETIIQLFTSTNASECIKILRILVLSIPVSAFGAYFSQILVIFRENRIVMKITLITAILNYTFLVPFVYFFGAIGVAISVVITRILHIILQIYYYKTKIYSL